MITISPDLSDPDNAKYKSTNLSAYPGYVGQFFEGPKADGSKITGCWFGIGGTCYKSWRWDWRAPGNFIGFHVFDTYNCNPSRDGDDCNYTIYFKAPDNYLITRIEFDYEKHVNYGGQDRVIFGLSPEVRIGIQGPYLRYDEGQQIPVNGPDSGHLSFNMEPATKYIYFYADSRTADADEYMWAMLRNIKFDLINVSQTEKPVVDVISNFYEIGKEITNPLDPKHETDCPPDAHCVEKICITMDPNPATRWANCSPWRYIYNQSTGQIFQDPIYGFPEMIEDKWVVGGKAKIYARACTYWGNNYCTDFMDEINYTPKYRPDCTNIRLNPEEAFIKGEPIQIRAKATDSDGTVQQVVFGYAKETLTEENKVEIGSGSYDSGTDEWVINWDTQNLEEGVYIIYAEAKDNDNQWCTAVGYNSCTDCRLPGVPIQFIADPWFQTKDGDVHSGGSISSDIPSTASEKYFCLNGSGGYPGVVSYNGTSADFSPGGSVSAPPAEWLAKTSSSKKSYNYFYSLLGSPSYIDPPLGGEVPSVSDGIVAYSGNISTPQSGWDVGTNKAVIITSGKYLIKGKIRIDTANGGSLVVIAQGGIGVSKNLVAPGTPNNRLQGVFITDGIFYTSVDEENFDFNQAESNKILVVDGMVIANQVELKRDFSVLGGGDYENDTTPAETFRYDPTLFMNIHPDLWKSAFTWEELAP